MRECVLHNIHRFSLTTIQTAKKPEAWACAPCGAQCAAICESHLGLVQKLHQCLHDSTLTYSLLGVHYPPQLLRVFIGIE